MKLYLVVKILIPLLGLVIGIYAYIQLWSYSSELFWIILMIHFSILTDISSKLDI